MYELLGYTKDEDLRHGKDEHPLLKQDSTVIKVTNKMQLYKLIYYS
jgi:hypothetical protein